VLLDPQPHFAPAFGQSMSPRVKVEGRLVRAAELRQVAQDFIPEGIQKRFDISRAPSEQKAARLLKQVRQGI
jgi:hypothetical protein